MPFQECSIMSQREAFCRQACEPGVNIRELCRVFEISPASGYKWLERYRAAGAEGLLDRSRRPATSPRRSGDELEAKVLAVRAAHPAWGGRKLRRVLENEGLSPPAASTITAILRRHGRLDGPGAGQRRAFIRFEHAAPNDLWQMDFKGWFGLPDGRCHPLTVLDDHSRFALELGACADEQAVTVRARLEAVFRRYGLPQRILADNGAPWGTGGLGSHSAFGVWLMDLDIGLIHGRPYHPQTQGKDERFHRTLKVELLDRIVFADLGQAQAAFDIWREVYNAKRPHEAIGLQTPAQRYRESPRSMPAAVLPPDYEAAAQVRTADAKGRIHFAGHRLYCSIAFAGKRLALRTTDQDGLFELCYRRHLLARVDLRQDTVQPVHHVSEQVFTMSPV
jgi:transposase InsO family protein